MKVKQGLLVDAPVAVFDDNPLGQVAGLKCGADRRGGKGAGARSGAPNLGEMGLAATGRAVNGKDATRPGRPAVDPVNRLFVAGRDQEILAATRRAVPQRQRQLPRRAQGLT
jgi:hypothetical protein